MWAFSQIPFPWHGMKSVSKGNDVSPLHPLGQKYMSRSTRVSSGVGENGREERGRDQEKQGGKGKKKNGEVVVEYPREGEMEGNSPLPPPPRFIYYSQLLYSRSLSNIWGSLGPFHYTFRYPGGGFKGDRQVFRLPDMIGIDAFSAHRPGSTSEIDKTSPPGSIYDDS